MRAVTCAVWPTIQPLESSLLRQRNYQITYELSMLRTNSLTINHIDADCQVVTRLGRLTFTFFLLFELFSYHLRASMVYNTIYKCRSSRICRVTGDTQDGFIDSSKAHFLQAITSFTSTVPSTAQPPVSEMPRKQKRPARTHPCPHANCPQVYKQLSGLRYHLSHVSPSCSG